MPFKLITQRRAKAEISISIDSSLEADFSQPFYHQVDEEIKKYFKDGSTCGVFMIDNIVGFYDRKAPICDTILTFKKYIAELGLETHNNPRNLLLDYEKQTEDAFKENRWTTNYFLSFDKYDIKARNEIHLRILKAKIDTTWVYLLDFISFRQASLDHRSFLSSHAMSTSEALELCSNVFGYTEMNIKTAGSTITFTYLSLKATEDKLHKSKDDELTNLLKESEVLLTLSLQSQLNSYHVIVGVNQESDKMNRVLKNAE